jgi:predicted metal-dependent HD superfamily phosphohydrolase
MDTDNSTISTALEVSDPVARRFDEVMLEFGQDQESETKKKWWDIIHKKYSEPTRYYHTLTHLGHMFQLFDKHGSQLQNSRAVILSIFFHDIVYDPRSATNEEDSAELFKEFVHDVSHPALSAVSSTVVDFILATKSHSADDLADSDKLSFLAFDMAILSVPLTDYQMYAKKIRSEYAHVDLHVYCTRRGAFLREVLDGGPVFHGKLDDHAEERMRVNLQWEVDILQKGILPE